MAMLSSHSIGKEIQEALGLPKHCRRITLNVEVGSIVTVEAEFYPEKDGVKKVVAIVKRFNLVPEAEVVDTTELGDEVRSYAFKETT